MNFWYTSDTHFGHENIIKYCNRPFATVKEMNEALLDYWNQTVKPEDVVYHLGDVAMGHFDESWEYVKKLNGMLYLVIGNHDRIAKRYGMGDKYFMKYATRYAERFVASEYEMQHMLTDTIKVKLHHMPHTGDHTIEERFANMRPSNDGLPLIHGHIHDLWKVNGAQFNVGVDVRAFKPVNRDELISEISGTAS